MALEKRIVLRRLHFITPMAEYSEQFREGYLEFIGWMKFKIVCWYDYFWNFGDWRMKDQEIQLTCKLNILFFKNSFDSTM